MAANKRSCCQHLKRGCTRNKLIECIYDAWKLRGGTPDKNKTTYELALGNLANLEKKELSVGTVERKVKRVLNVPQEKEEL